MWWCQQAPVAVAASPPLNPTAQLPSKPRETRPFTASRAFQSATLAVAPLLFQTGSSRLALMAAKLQAHISICQPDEPEFIALCRVLHLLSVRKVDQGRMRSVWADRKKEERKKQQEAFWIHSAIFYRDGLWSTDKTSKIKPLATFITIITAERSMHIPLSQNPISEKINIPQRECRLFHMSSITHSCWAICNSHFGFEGSWALNREEFPFEGRIRWNRPMIISILMAL